MEFLYELWPTGTEINLTLQNENIRQVRKLKPVTMVEAIFNNFNQKKKYYFFFNGLKWV